MARGGARPGAGRPTEKRANTSRPPTPARAPAREADGDERPWPADNVERWSIDRLIPYAKNSRTHSEAQIAQLAASMQEWGWTNPVLADEAGGVVAGHARILAARQLGFGEVPVMVARGWSDAQKRAYVIADNQLALNAGWDNELLSLELGELNLAGFDLSLTGFGDLELKDLLADRTEGLTDPDDAPEAPEHPVSEPGDLWLLGKHRLLCGDSTVATDVERVIGGVAPHLMVTDPPYGVGFERGKFVARETAAKGQTFAPIANNDLRGQGLTEFIARSIGLWAGERATIYMWSSVLEGYSLMEAIKLSGFKIQSQIVWKKTPFVVGRADYHWQHEFCWYGFKGPDHPWYGGRDKGTVWEIPKLQKMEHHPTAKPVECMRRPIENNSSPGQAVYEPFCGSGTTIIAAEMTGRACHAIELSPAYIDVAVQRWQDFTGNQATLDGDGRSFNDIATARRPRMTEANTAAAA